MSVTASPEAAAKVQAAPAEIYRIADDRIEVMSTDGVALADGHELDLNDIRFNMLASLAKRPDRTVSLPDISQDVWGTDISASSNALSVHMSLLRKTLGQELGDPREGAIRTRPGFGYSAVSSLSRIVHDRNSPGIYRIADERVLISPVDMSVVADGRFIDDITPKELIVLSELARVPDRVVGLGSLGLNIWGYTDKSLIGTLRVHVSNVRRRLGAELGDPKAGALRTRRDIGYYAVSSLES